MKYSDLVWKYSSRFVLIIVAFWMPAAVVMALQMDPSLFFVVVGIFLFGVASWLIATSIDLHLLAKNS